MVDMYDITVYMEGLEIAVEPQMGYLKFCKDMETYPWMRVHTTTDSMFEIRTSMIRAIKIVKHGDEQSSTVPSVSEFTNFTKDE